MVVHSFEKIIPRSRFGSVRGPDNEHLPRPVRLGMRFQGSRVAALGYPTPFVVVSQVVVQLLTQLVERFELDQFTSPDNGRRGSTSTSVRRAHHPIRTGSLTVLRI